MAEMAVKVICKIPSLAQESKEGFPSGFRGKNLET